MKFDLSSLPPTVVVDTLSRASSLQARTGAVAKDNHAAAWGHNEQIDVNLTIANIARVAIVTSGMIAAFGALTTEQGTRHQLQCALSAVACLVTTGFYVKLYAVRRAKAIAYSRAGSAAVDSYRHSCWAVTNGVLAWVGLLLHGPFDADGSGTMYGMDYSGWLRAGPALSCASVVLSGGAQFCAETARYTTFGSRPFLLWGLFGLAFVLSAMFASISVSTALSREGDSSARSRTEIHIGQILGALWFVYPGTNILKIMVTFLSTHNAAELLGPQAAKRVADPIYEVGSGVRDALLWSLRVISASHAYSPLPDRAIDEAQSKMGGYALVPPVYTQMFDALLAVCDVVSIGMPALACTALALPVAG
jgi:hypothetical protein